MPSNVQSVKKRSIVLDTAALIGGTESLFALGGVIDPKTKAPLRPPEPDEQVSFYTTPDVIHEVRDARARSHLELLSGVLVVRLPSAEALAEVTRFSRATGDYAVLSLTDLRVIALCWMLEVERDGGSCLRPVPKLITSGHIRIGRLIPFEEVDRMEQEERDYQDKLLGADDGWVTVGNKHPSSNVDTNIETNVVQPSSDSSPPTTVTQSAEQPADNTAVTEKKKGKRQTLTKKPPINEVVPVPSQSPATAPLPGSSCNTDTAAQCETIVSTDHSVGDDLDALSAKFGRSSLTKEPLDHDAGLQSDNVTGTIISEDALVADDAESDEESDDGVGWINPDNLDEHLARDAKEDLTTPEEEVRVGCVTTDFAMQNTMLQMGLKILTVDGRRTIRKIKHFALRCHSCGLVTRELEKQFCDKCGNAAMHRVAFKVNKSGVAHAFINPKKVPRLRGTKYSLPTPHGGRNNTDLILCADQIDPIQQRRIEKRMQRLNVDVFDPSTFYNAGARYNPHDKPLIVGHGRRNPNEVRPSSRKKR